jgi:hypothetical protein
MHNNNPTYTISLTNFRLDRDDCDNLIDTDARYVLVDSRIWLDYIVPLINENDELHYALRHCDFSGPHAITVS